MTTSLSMYADQTFNSYEYSLKRQCIDQVSTSVEKNILHEKCRLSRCCTIAEDLHFWWRDFTLCPEKSHQEIEKAARTILNAVDCDSKTATNTKRYRPQPISATDKLVKTIFERAYKAYPQNIFDEAKKVRPIATPYSSPIKNVIFIRIPKKIAEITRKPIFKIAVCIVAFSIGIIVGQKSYYMLYPLLERVVSFGIDNAPFAVIQAARYTNDLKNYIFDTSNLGKIIIGILAVKLIFRGLPRIPIVTDLVNRIHIVDVAFFFIFHTPQTTFEFIVYRTWAACSVLWDLSGNISFYSNRIARNNEDTENSIRKTEASTIWQESIKVFKENRSNHVLVS